MRVLVTGASGRVGRAILSRLSPEHELRGFDKAPTSAADIIGDLRDRRAVERAVAGSEAIVHVGGLHAPHVGVASDAEFEEINVGGTRNLLDAARRHGVERFIYTSTTAVYGQAAASDAAAWVTEGMDPQPRTIYHRTKLAAEALVSAAAAEAGGSYRILRMSRCFPEPAAAMAAYRLHRGVDARDVAEAHALALNADLPGCRVYNISGSTPFEPSDMSELGRDAASVLKRRAPELAAAFEARGWPLPGRIDRVYVARKAEMELSWRPRFGFAEVLKMLDEGSSEVLPPTTKF